MVVAKDNGFTWVTDDECEFAGLLSDGLKEVVMIEGRPIYVGFSILQDLYNSEINFRIETFRNDGFIVYIGDELNGYRDSANYRTINECIKWLIKRALELYPDSKFARKKEL